MYEKIKFSNLRNIFLALRYFLRFLGNKFKVFKSLEYKDFELSSNNEEAGKILIFCPSLNLDTPHFLNVGLRAFINAAKYLGVKIEIIQCFNFLNICHLGGSPFSDNNKMPCYSCEKVNSKLYKDINTIKLSFLKVDYENELQQLSFDELKNYTFEGINLGELVSSSIIWIKRHSDLNEESKDYFIKLINDSKNLKCYFDNLNLEDYKGILVFNGISFPESILYKICEEKNLNVATFEGGMSKNFNYSIEFNYGFTPQHFFKFDMDKNYENDYFEDQEFFTAKTHNLISEKMDSTVSIFTNVSWDTSQFVSNNLFDSMYEWLENLKPLFKQYKSINFVIKPHPGENRKIKKTFYTVSSWYEENIRNQYSNVSIVLNNKSSTSYKLLKRSNLVLVYNSTIGIEIQPLHDTPNVPPRSDHSDIGLRHAWAVHQQHHGPVSYVDCDGDADGLWRCANYPEHFHGGIFGGTAICRSDVRPVRAQTGADRFDGSFCRRIRDLRFCPGPIQPVRGAAGAGTWRQRHAVGWPGDRSRQF